MKHGQTTLDPCHRALFREPRNLNRPSKILKLCSGFMIHVVSIDKWWQVALFIIVSSCLLGTWRRRRLYKPIKSTSPGVCAECGTPSFRDHPLGKKNVDARWWEEIVYGDGKNFLEKHKLFVISCHFNVIIPIAIKRKLPWSWVQCSLHSAKDRLGTRHWCFEGRHFCW